MIAIRYTGRENRHIDEYQWTAANGHVCKVPAELAASLLTYPYGGFELAGTPGKADQKALDKLFGIEAEEPAITSQETEVTDGE